MSLPSLLPDNYDPPDHSEEIDLRVYARALMARWRAFVLIVLGTIVVIAGGYALYTSLQTPGYAASADVAIVRTSSEVSFDETFTTASGQVSPSSATAQRNALVSLAASPSLATDVLAALPESLRHNLGNGAQLAGAVRAELASAPGGRAGDSELIRITVIADTPEKAAALATAWAEAYVTHVNQLYGEVPNDLLVSVQAQLADAEADYAAAQAALEQFRTVSNVDQLNRQILDVEYTLDALHTGQQQTLSSVVDQLVAARSSVAATLAQEQARNITEPFAAQQAARRAQVLAYIDAVKQGQTAVFTEQVERDRGLLDSYYTRWLQVSLALDEAATLRQQAQGGEEQLLGSSALVLSLLRLQASTSVLDPAPPQTMNIQAGDQQVDSAAQPFPAAPSPGAMQSTQPVQVQVGATPLQIQLSDGNSVPRQTYLAELDQFIQTLTARRAELEQAIGDLSADILSGTRYAYLGATVPEDSALAQAVAAGVQATGAISGSAAIEDEASRVLASGLPALETLLGLPELAALGNLSAGDQLLATLDGLEEQLRALKAQHEIQSGEQRRLELYRDRAFDTLTTVSNKIAELNVARSAANTVVRLAAPAAVPAAPVDNVRMPLVLALATVIGVALGGAYVIMSVLRQAIDKPA